MKNPTVAIVGRPNVGKSTLLNRMAHSRVSIVEPTAGVTRDRLTVPVRLETTLGTRHISVVDTGGIGIVDRDDLGPHVEAQVAAAVAASALVLFVVDAREGVTPLDREVAERLRRTGLPVLLVANKAESLQQEWNAAGFHELGLAEGPFLISAQNGTGLSPLYERVAELLPRPEAGEAAPRPLLRIAVVGRRNAGKSTLVNALAREERVIVSELPGTTRDSVDVLIERDGECFAVIDTAGLRRRTKLADAIEFYSDARSHRAVRRADVVLLLFDATQEVGAIEKKLARYAVDHYKPVVLVANKWDLVEGPTLHDFERYVSAHLKGLSFAPLAAMSAKTGKGVEEVLALARELHEEALRRVPTGELNRVIARATQARTPSWRGQHVRIRYVTQVHGAPPTFVLFAKNEKMIGKEYLRYLENRLREELDLHHVPMRFVIRSHNEAPSDTLR